MTRRYFYDTEFLDDGHWIDFISLGMVTEDGRPFYAVSSDFDLNRLLGEPWLLDNVVPGLPVRLHRGGNGTPSALAWDPEHPDFPCVRPRAIIAADVIEFVRPDKNDVPELWAYYNAHDHVALTQLFGRMVDLPEGMPKRTRDLAELRDHVRAAVRRRGDADDVWQPPDPDAAHNSGADAQWNLELWRALTRQLGYPVPPSR